jgi:UDPglucose 6-dehydrogenase
MRIAFIGLGKLGMPCAETLAKKGYTDITGYDVVQKSSELVDIKPTLAEAIKGRDAVFIATPTPHEEGYDGRAPTAHLEPKDFNYESVKSVLKQCNDLMNDDQVVVLVSTVLPGTIRRELAPIMTNVKLIYNPYLIAMGSVEYDMLNPEMIMIGTKKGVEETAVKAGWLRLLYDDICENNPRIEFGTWEEIEAIKIFYNTFISNKIALVNMIQDVAQRLGSIDVDKVAKALSKSTQRITGPSYMKPGMGDGGACHPRDNIALRWLAKDLGLGYDIFQTIITAREKQAENMALAILKHGKNIYFTSDSFKPGTSMVDGSYSLLVQHYVKKHGGKLANGFDNPVQVIVRVHESDQISADNNTVIFDPWRSYPPADNVVYYGKKK